MRRFHLLIAFACLAPWAMAQLAYNHEFVSSDFNNNTIVSKGGGAVGQAFGGHTNNKKEENIGIRLDGDGLFNGLSTNWDEKYVVIKLADGVPYQLSFSCATTVGDLTTYNLGKPYFYIIESATNGNWTDTVWTMRERSCNTTQVNLSKTTKYIKLMYKGNYAGIFKGVTVSELISMGTATPDTIDFGTVHVDDQVSAKTFQVAWTNLTATVSSNDTHFSVTPASIGTIGKYDQNSTIQVSLSTTTAGTYKGAVTVEGRNKKTAAVVIAKVEKHNQTITWNPTTTLLTTGSITPATTNSGLNVSYDITGDAVTYNATTNTFTIVKNGSVTITAKQEGNYKYNAATSVSKTFTISKATPTITTAPTAPTITYPATIATSTLTGGAASVAGSFTWNVATTQTLLPGTHSLDVLFTPTNTNWYNTVNTKVTLEVLPWETEGTETAIVCPGTTYLYHGQEYAAGTHTVHLTNQLQGDSAVTLIVGNYVSYTSLTENATICQGDTLTWNDTTLTSQGDYTFHGQTTNGCDSIVTLHLTVLPAYTDLKDSATICQGDTLTWNEKRYCTAGDYTFYGKTTDGCDSIITLHLTVLPAYNIKDSATICQDELVGYRWQGHHFSNDTLSIQDTLLTQSGCDSIVTFTLRVLPSYSNVKDSATICQGDSLLWNNQVLRQAGPYQFMGKTAQGCDSIVTLHLFVLPSYPSIEEQSTICQGDTLVWNDTTLTTQGTYTFHGQTTQGCDSVVTLSLRVLPSYLHVEDSATICYGETFTWNDSTYTLDGDHIFNGKTTLGCDSIITLHLHILPEERNHIDSLITKGDNFEWNNIHYGDSIPGLYKDTMIVTSSTGCDSILSLSLTIIEKTGLLDVLSDEQFSTEKILINGTLYIRRKDHIYTAEGLLVE